MGLDEVAREIERNAKALHAKAVEDARREASKITDAAKAGASEIKNRANLEAAQEADAMKQRELSALKLGLKHELLNSRRRIMEEIKEKTAERLQGPGNKEVVLAKLLKAAMAELPDAATAYANSSDMALLKKIAPNLRHKALPENEHGLVLEDQSGKVMANYTFGLLLDRLFDKKLGEIYREVFGNA